MNCLVGGPLLVGGLGPEPLAPPPKSGPVCYHDNLKLRASILTKLGS